MIPPALLEAMAEAVLETASFADVTCLVNPKSVAIEVISAAERAGWVMVERDRLIRLAHTLDASSFYLNTSMFDDVIGDLRQAAGEGT